MDTVINTHPVREFLRSYWELARETDRLARRIETLTAAAEKATSLITGMPRGGGGDGGGHPAWDALADARTRCGEKLVDALKRETEIESFIGRITNPRYRQLLRYRYLCHLTYEQLADEMDITSRHARRMHNWALAEAEKLWDEEVARE